MRQYISRASFNPGAKFLILFINSFASSSTFAQKELAFRLFKLMYDRYNAANVVFLYAVDVEVYNVYVTNPYTNPDECGRYSMLLCGKKKG